MIVIFKRKRVVKNKMSIKSVNNVPRERPVYSEERDIKSIICTGRG